MRRGKLSGPPEIKKPEQSSWVSQIREYRLITPLFGGGVEAGRPDEITAVRGASVRGQLRFWWRATRAGRYATLSELKAAEDLLWGAASRAALVELSVEVLDPGRDFSYQTQQGTSTEVGHFRSPYSYVAFPLQQDKGVVREGVRFTLRMRLPRAWKSEETQHFAGSPEEELAAALWAWETFGGVGARTRRGFGAIECVAVDGERLTDTPGKEEIRVWIERQLKNHVVEGAGPRSVPRLSRDMRWYRTTLARRAASDRAAEALGAWRLLFDKLKAFRQPRPPGSDDPRRPGRSRWPEPEAIRTITGQRLEKHEERPGSGKFPRAVFGLPIIYQFKDNDKRDTYRKKQDPAQTSLQGLDDSGSELERLASPLIIRPLAVADGVVSLALVLDTPRLPPGGLILKRSKDRQVLSSVEATLTPAESDAIRDQAGQRPLLRGSTDVLEAFLNYLEQ